MKALITLEQHRLDWIYSLLAAYSDIPMFKTRLIFIYIWGLLAYIDFHGVSDSFW